MAEEIQAPATEKDVRVRVFEGHKDTIWRVVMPVDGRFALTSSADGTVRKWDLEEGAAKSAIVCKAKSFIGLAVTANGSHAAAGDREGNIHFLDLFLNQELAKWYGHNTRVGNLAFLVEDRELLSAATDGYLRRWETNSGTLIAQCKLPFGHLFNVAVSADDSRIVGAAWNEGQI